ncbi:PBP family phospholipid-binding protein [Hydrogenivirga caldilitoris]|uniref:PBP family phospholipid-binding protein n=1 Tax=Hydrogenivirga caldilitoris TaxID=246264 RepID=A0A497XPB3_9AQUI|nr:YbhB/YbcL family Raf kinase inhibitor-like protein [Hydrogenivirga caldilitoris]RLJ70797.1 PBP family phospholipid-binding protein [Hydrogenivirga caldilitoris]
MLGFILPTFLIAAATVLGGENMKLESTAFKEGEVIPVKYTCEGIDVSPPITWSGAPAGTRSFVLIMDDPDAPIGTFTHWVVYDIPSDVGGFAEDLPKVKEIEGIKQGLNDFGYIGYGGPCPPKGHGYHRYFFKLFALDIDNVGLPPGASRQQVEERMKGHILGEASFMGRYKRD